MPSTAAVYCNRSSVAETAISKKAQSVWLRLLVCSICEEGVSYRVQCEDSFVGEEIRFSATGGKAVVVTYACSSEPQFS